MNFILAPLRWLDRNAERTLILFAYSAMALIIVYAVFEREFSGLTEAECFGGFSDGLFGSGIHNKNRGGKLDHDGVKIF